MDDYSMEEALRDVLDEMDDVDFINLHNEMAREYGDNLIYEMSEIDEILNIQKNYAISDVLRDLDSDFDYYQEYFTIDDHGIIKSFDSLLDHNSPVDRDETLRYIVDTGFAFGNDAIQEVIDQYY